MARAPQEGPAEVVVGVDVGGTFTDAVVVADGRVTLAKAPTTPADQSEGVLHAVGIALASAGVASPGVARFTHGMTVGTNALLEGTGAPIALVTTAGFADVIALRRQDRAHLYRLDAAHPEPLVPPERRFEVRERCGPDGVIEPLDAPSVDAAVDAVAASGVEAVAVCLLFAFRDPSHERAVADRFAERLPGVHVSLSSDVLPEIREYERLSTTCVDAHLAPVMRRYLERLADRAAGAGLPAPRIMQSSGGTTDLETASMRAAWTVLSGPAGGVIGAAHAAALAGEPRILTFDMGGTSCDVALVDGEPARTGGSVVAGHAVNLPMLDIHTVSAGGGSIAWADSGGALRVGPHSAGARPGPACYGRGGEAPTVTDADLVLGRIDTALPFGDGLRLDRASAVAAVAALAAGLGLSTEDCAAGIVRIAEQQMARALRVVSVERGVDPRDMALVAFGGAGPLHACAVAEELGMRRVLVPAAAGALAALGLVVAEERTDRSRSVLWPLDRMPDPGPLVGALAADALGALPGAALAWSADCRYAGQTHALNVPWDPSAPPGALAAAFNDAHRRRMGAADATTAVELVTVRVAATRPGTVPDLAARGVPRTVEGPATLVLDGATGWVPAGWRADARPDGSVVMSR